MSGVTQVPPGFTLGDGTTAGEVASDRWRRWRWGLGVGALTLVVVILLAIVRPPSSTQPLSIANHQPSGARAVAEVLRDQGVSVTEVSALADASARLTDEATLVIGSYTFLARAQVESIMSHPGPIVWLAPDASALDAIDTSLTTTGIEPSTLVADCAAPHARRAERLVGITALITLVEPIPGLEVCFSDDGGASGAYLRMERDGGDVHLIADAAVVDNGGLGADGGAAALALGTLGSSDTLVWYSASPFDDTLLDGDRTGTATVEPTTPAWVGAGLVAAALVVLVAAAWRGRRMGPLVTEPLPVIVRASEATRGRARLYRRGRSAGHAAAALRAGAAARMAARLGVPPAAGPDALCAAVASATGRPDADIRNLIYGAPPPDERSMLDLIARLDALEGEVAAS